MKTMIPPKLVALGILLMVMASIAVACGGETRELTPLTPTPVVEPTVAPTKVEPATATVTAPTKPAADKPEPTKPPIGIELRLIIMKRAPDDTVTVLEKGGVLTADDFYGIFFEPPADSWVYVLQQDSTGAISVLFPNPAFSDLTNPLSAGTPVWIPKDFNNWFFLDQNVGRESFFVVASKERQEELESLIAGGQREDVLGPLAKLLDEGGRGLGGVETLKKVPKLLPDGNSPELEEQLLQGDGDNFVYSLEFEHK